MTTSQMNAKGALTFTSESRLKTFAPRIPLAAMALLFILISMRYMVHPISTAAAAGISFTSPDGITVARVGFAGFPLAIAALVIFCAISERRVLFGLAIAVTVLTSVILVRLFGVLADHSGVANLRLFVPEFAMTFFSILAMRVELQRRRAAHLTNAA